jgi:hypothetical protein
LKSVFRGKMEIPTVRFGDLETKVIVMAHPSGQNPLALFNTDLQQLIDKEINHNGFRVSRPEKSVADR